MLQLVQLCIAACIVVGLFACFVGWQASRQEDFRLADLLPRFEQSERNQKAAVRRQVTVTPAPSGADRGKAQPATPVPSAQSEQPQVQTGAGEGGAAPTPAAPVVGAEVPAQAAGVAAVPVSSQAAAPRGLLAHLPARTATRLVVPSLKVDAPVVLVKVRDGTWDVGPLAQEVGHLQGTASPGDSSNVVLAGHITLAQGGYGPFKALAQLKVGETATVYVGDTQYNYTIRSVDVVPPDKVSVTYPTSEPVLTLITCANWDRSAGRYKDRVVAVGYLAGK